MKKFFVIFSLMVFGGVLLTWNVGTTLSAAVNTEIGEPPVQLGGSSIVVDDLHGWFIPGKKPSKCVLLLHGIRSNRTAMISRAQFLQKAGYSSFLIDLQAHGETKGEHITFGYEESGNAKTAIDYLRQNKNCQKIASLGQSLGGAASLLGKSPLEVDAFIIESVYSNIETAVFNRLDMRVGLLAHILAPMIYQQIPLRLGIPLDELRPIDKIANINAPILIMAGSKDRHTTLSESENMYDKAPQPKEILVIEGAKHVDLYRFSPEKYREKVIGFLNKYL